MWWAAQVPKCWSNRFSSLCLVLPIWFTHERYEKHVNDWVPKIVLDIWLPMFNLSSTHKVSNNCVDTTFMNHLRSHYHTVSSGRCPSDKTGWTSSQSLWNNQKAPSSQFLIYVCLAVLNSGGFPQLLLVKEAEVRKLTVSSWQTEKDAHANAVKIFDFDFRYLFQAKYPQYQ